MGENAKMGKHTKEEVIDERKLKRNELICGILGLAIAVVSAIFFFVKVISLNIEIVEGQSVDFTTSVFRFLKSDFNVNYDNAGILYWTLFNPDFGDPLIKDYDWILVAAAWISLIGCVVSAIFYVLWLIGKRFPFFCEMTSRMAAGGCILAFLFFFFGEIKVSNERFYADGVKYNYILPVIYMAVMVIALIFLNYLCNYSKKRREALEQARIEQAALATVSATQQPQTSIQNAQFIMSPVTEMAENIRTESGAALQESTELPKEEIQTPAKATSALRQAVLAKYNGQIHDNAMVYLSQGLDGLSSAKLNELLQKPIKKKVITILLAIFLGGIGVDRFYVGDTRMGIAKLLGTIVVLLSRLVPVPFLYLILNIANGIWKFVDIFFSYKKGQEKNGDEAMEIIKS